MCLGKGDIKWNLLEGNSLVKGFIIKDFPSDKRQKNIFFGAKKEL